MSANSFITVHLRVNDAATGEPTAVRLRIAGPNGDYFAPFGRVAEFPVGLNEDVGGNVYLGGKRYTYIEGACEIRLPTGVPLEVEITKGPDYIPIRETVILGPGKMALRFSIHLGIISRPIGWLSADTRCHGLSPQAAILEAACEDVSLAYVLAAEHDYPSQDGHLYRSVPELLAFSGQLPALVVDPHLVAVSTLNAHPALGKLGLLYSHRPVYPLSFGGEQTDDWSLCDWADQCHRKRGFVVWCDACRSGLPGGEALVAAVLGKIDAIELDAQERSQPFLPFWHRLLDAGICLPLVGASGKNSNRIALGSMRTQTRMEGPEWKLADWVERTRAGRTFVTNGPFLSMVVDEMLPGEYVTLTSERPVAIRAAAFSLVPFDKLEIIANGSVIADASPSPVNGNPHCCAAEIAIEHTLPEGGWIAARCFGASKSALDLSSPVFAHTSPVFVKAASGCLRTVSSAIRALAADIEHVRLWVERDGRFTQEKSKSHLLALCDDALRVLANRQSEV